jgi:hypothetical protein
MKRRLGLLSVVVVVVVTVAAVSRQPCASLLMLDWANKGSRDTPPSAVLIEFGIKDAKKTDWSGSAAVTGARVVHREGYRFRNEDKLDEPRGWTAWSRRGVRVPAKQPQVSKMEPLATVGVVLHLADVKDDATLTIELKDAALGKQTVPLKAVLAGTGHKLWNGSAVVRLISTATPVEVGTTEDDFPAACHGPDGTLWVAYISYRVRDDGRRIEQKPYKEQPVNFNNLYTPEFGDRLFVKAYRGGNWSKPIAVTGAKEDLARCAIAAEGNGTVWVVYSANRKGRPHQLFGRPLRTPAAKGAEVPEIKLGEEKQLTEQPYPVIAPVMCTDQAGNVWLAGQGHVGPVLQCRNGAWEERGLTGDGSGHSFAWYRALAASPGIEVADAVDFYTKGSYDVNANLWDARKNGPVLRGHAIASTSRFEARPSVAYDLAGRLWIAYEEGPEYWGKDYGTLAKKEGSPLYTERSIRVVCLDANGKLLRPVADLPTSTAKAPDIAGDALKTNRFERSTKYAYPKIGIDGKGRVWLTYRQNFGSRYSSLTGSYWLTFARRLDGDHWSEPIEIHHSDGLLDARPVVLPHSGGGLLVVHNTDGRYTTPETIDNQIYMSTIDLPGEPVEPKLVPHDAGKPNPIAVQKAKAEAEAVARMRTYRVKSGGKAYRLLRGEFHRHTEISWDGGPDGSLEDMFRYAIDAAAMDWIGNGDHDNGAGREYPWWLTQKFTDAYHVAGRFTAMFTYERSVSYPHGHRNVMFAKRGVRTLPRLAAGKEKPVAGIHPDDTKMLYRYLHELGGICAAHTTATGMGTDWRDHDAKVEPIVEIYQGDRMSYEQEGAPRAGYEAKSGKQPINVAGWFPKGYVNNALDKGYRLGFQSSSDHWSTHISFFVALAERNDRAAILDATRKRHCYAATDNIVLDLRSGDHIMGDEFTTNAPPTLEIAAIGTNKIAKIDVMRDGEVVETIKPQGTEYRGKWTDPQPRAGLRYYYVRVLQTDEEIAWASPMWITYKKGD